MTRATRRHENTGKSSQVLYLSFELGVEEWKLGFGPDLGSTPRVRVIRSRDLTRLTREIAAAKQWFGLPPTAIVRSCYEAGRDGFWLHRYLTSTGIDNRVVDSSSIEVNRRQRRAKSDRLDVRKLLTMLIRYHAGDSTVWSVLRVPTVEEENRRQLHRELRTLKKEHTRITNRIHGLLANHGIRLSKIRQLSILLDGIRLWDGSPLPAGLRVRLQREWEPAQFVGEQIAELERERHRAIAHDRGPAAEKVRQILRLRGIGPNGASVYVNEFFGWRQFRNRKEVGAAAGLTPTSYLTSVFPPPRKNTLVRDRCSVPRSGCCQRTPCRAIHSGTRRDSSIVISASGVLAWPPPTRSRSSRNSSRRCGPVT